MSYGSGVSVKGVEDRLDRLHKAHWIVIVISLFAVITSMAALIVAVLAWQRPVAPPVSDRSNNRVITTGLLWPPYEWVALEPSEALWNSWPHPHLLGLRFFAGFPSGARSSEVEGLSPRGPEGGMGACRKACFITPSGFPRPIVMSKPNMPREPSGSRCARRPSRNVVRTVAPGSLQVMGSVSGKCGWCPSGSSRYG